jgi:NifU-like protein involved in Fe-S cluster formation
MLALVKLELGPTRLRCALLALEGLQKGIADVASSKIATGT